MIHHTALDIAIFKIAMITAPVTGFSVASVPTENGLPNWLNGTIAGGVIIVLLFLIKFLAGLWQEKDKELNRLNRDRIEQLEEENKRLRRELKENQSE